MPDLSDAVHVYPLNDLQEHVTEGTDCPCNPTVKPEDGGWIILHNSFDGREAVEWANEILDEKPADAGEE